MILFREEAAGWRGSPGKLRRHGQGRATPAIHHDLDTFGHRLSDHSPTVVSQMQLGGALWEESNLLKDSRGELKPIRSGSSDRPYRINSRKTLDPATPVSAGTSAGAGPLRRSSPCTACPAKYKKLPAASASNACKLA